MDFIHSSFFARFLIRVEVGRDKGSTGKINKEGGDSQKGKSALGMPFNDHIITIFSINLTLSRLKLYDFCFSLKCGSIFPAQVP